MVAHISSAGRPAAFMQSKLFRNKDTRLNNGGADDGCRATMCCGFGVPGHAGGKLAVGICAGATQSLDNNNATITALRETALPKLNNKFNVVYSLEGRRADQGETLRDVRLRGVFAVAIIHLVLA